MATELEKSQNNHGGRRTGSGRKQMHGGEENTRKIKRLFNEYVTEEQVTAIFSMAIADAMAGKTEMQKFILEQLFGKATQRTELTGAEGEALQILFDNSFKQQ